MNKIIQDERGRVIGREVNGNLLDGQGRMKSRHIESSDLTVDEKGRKTGTGDQRLRQLDK